MGAHGSARWALPEPEAARALALRAPGGPRTQLPLDTLPAHHQLLYQNFIYVAFSATQHTYVSWYLSVARGLRARTATAVGYSGEGGKQAADDSVLVLEVPLGSTRVVLARKRYGDR